MIEKVILRLIKKYIYIYRKLKNFCKLFYFWKVVYIYSNSKQNLPA